MGFVCPRDPPWHRHMARQEREGERDKFKAGVVIGRTRELFGEFGTTVGACDSNTRYLGKGLLELEPENLRTLYPSSDDLLHPKTIREYIPVTCTSTDCTVELVSVPVVI